MSVAQNIASIHERIAQAARRANRSPEEITLMAVTKTVAAARIKEAYNAGIRVFGENRVQEFTAKAAELHDLQEAQWHLIGHLQSNKSNQAAELFTAIDSLDSMRLAQRLNSAAHERGKKLATLLEINIAGEASKHGFSPHSLELRDLLKQSAELPHLKIGGLMAVPPFTEDAESVRPHFRQLRQLRDELAKISGMNPGALSMGMSHDFEIAIEEGSTCVRVGTAIFGERPGADQHD
ncbi:MAG TPA: YggS family pyridoxal phosphate-dependent enzyme [Terriglobales bacterium]|jgi:pyridoxal phosphate enzyme (YggS family)|nr:YggS family pyridoxal phosphate-dependent enzyme [Terriglobales bacterium]